VWSTGLAATSMMAISSSTIVNQGFVATRIAPKITNAMATRISNRKKGSAPRLEKLAEFCSGGRVNFRKSLTRNNFAVKLRRQNPTRDFRAKPQHHSNTVFTSSPPTIRSNRVLPRQLFESVFHPPPRRSFESSIYKLSIDTLNLLCYNTP
jgi:hypothetical protein